MRVAGCAGDADMTDHLADRVKVNTGIDHEACRAVPQIVQVKVIQPCELPCLLPSPLDVGIGLGLAELMIAGRSKLTIALEQMTEAERDATLSDVILRAIGD